MSVQPQKPDHLEKMIENQSVAVDPVDPDRFQMRIARDGTWYHQGSPIRRLGLVKLFATVLRLEEDGGYWLVGLRRPLPAWAFDGVRWSTDAALSDTLTTLQGRRVGLVDVMADVDEARDLLPRASAR